MLERYFGCLEEFGRAQSRNLIGGIESVEMGKMTVVVLRIIDIVEPFLQLSPAAHLHGRQLRQLFADGLQQRILVIQHLGRLQHLGEQFGDNLVVHRHTGIERRTATLASVFGRLARRQSGCPSSHRHRA